jgi:hypothetical protein
VKVVAPGHVVLEEVVELGDHGALSTSGEGRSAGTLCQHLSTPSKCELEEALAKHEE